MLKIVMIILVLSATKNPPNKVIMNILRMKVSYNTLMPIRYKQIYKTNIHTHAHTISHTCISLSVLCTLCFYLKHYLMRNWAQICDTRPHRSQEENHEAIYKATKTNKFSRGLKFRRHTYIRKNFTLHVE